MRYYDITLSGGLEFSSLLGSGGTDPGALNVELDCYVYPIATPAGATMVTIWGSGITTVAQAKNLWGQTVTIKGGFAPGLPLATAASAYAGVLLKGSVFQAFANWIGTEQTLNLVIIPGPVTTQTPQPTRPNPPHNLILNWKAGTPLSAALQNMLQGAFPGYKVSGTINSGLVLPHDEQGFFGHLNELGPWLRTRTQAILGGTYPGVDVVFDGQQFTMFDNTSNENTPKQIQFQDLIGQPTWIEYPTIQFKSVMRADLKVSDGITLPQTQVNNTQQAQSSQANQYVGFQGTFKVGAIRHVGNYRQPSGESWVTIVNAYPSTD